MNNLLKISKGIKLWILPRNTNSKGLSTILNGDSTKYKGVSNKRNCWTSERGWNVKITIQGKSRKNNSRYLCHRKQLESKSTEYKNKSSFLVGVFVLVSSFLLRAEMSTPEESHQENSIYFYISFDSITLAVCSVLPPISFCRGPVNTDLKGFPRQLCPFCRLQIEAHVRVNAGGGVKMGCLDGGTLINLKQAHQHADVDTSNDVWIRYSVYPGRFQCTLWLHRMSGVCLPPRTGRDTHTQWAHDVVATLSQRQWRWFNVATTSWDTRRENVVFTQILYIETLTPTKLLPLQIWYRQEVSGMDNERQSSTECYTLPF